MVYGYKYFINWNKIYFRAFMTLEYIAEVKDGHLSVIDKGRFYREIQSFNGEQVEVYIKRRVAKRSMQSNKYYWGVVVAKIRMAIHEQTGESYTREEIHEYLKQKFNPARFHSVISGEEDVIGKSTSHLNQAEFSEFVEKCKVWCLDFFGVDVDAGDIC